MGLYLCVRRPNSCRDKEVGSQRIAGLVQDVSEPQVTVHSNQDIEEHATAAGGTGNSDYKLQRFCQIWQYHNKCLVWQVLIVTVNRWLKTWKLHPTCLTLLLQVMLVCLDATVWVLLLTTSITLWAKWTIFKWLLPKRKTQHAKKLKSSVCLSPLKPHAQ